jgi:hypothetical protein
MKGESVLHCRLRPHAPNPAATSPPSPQGRRPLRSPTGKYINQELLPIWSSKPLTSEIPRAVRLYRLHPQTRSRITTMLLSVGCSEVAAFAASDEQIIDKPGAVPLSVQPSEAPKLRRYKRSLHVQTSPRTPRSVASTMNPPGQYHSRAMPELRIWRVCQGRLQRRLDAGQHLLKQETAEEGRRTWREEEQGFIPREGNWL